MLANAPLILGIILIAFVLLVPKGLVPTLGDLGQWLLRARARRAATGLRPEAGGGELMAAPLLETRDLSMHFGGVQAVRNVNFTLAEGELRCLIGPNGAGKSTFFKMLTGQLEPSQGAGAVPRHGHLPRPRPSDRAARHRHQDPGAERVRRPERAREYLARGEPHPFRRARQCAWSTRCWSVSA